jgi:hypothetical protein
MSMKEENLLELVQISKQRGRLPNQFFHIYSDYIAFISTFMQNKPMSVVGMRDGTLGFAFGVNNDRFFSLVPLLLESLEFKQMGLSYFEVVPNYEGIVHDFKKNKLKRYCISLPDLTLTGIPPVRLGANYGRQNISHIMEVEYIGLLASFINKNIQPFVR